MSDSPDDIGRIRSLVRSIEGDPLLDRAAGFSTVHEELSRMLESEDAPPDE